MAERYDLVLTLRAVDEIAGPLAKARAAMDGVGEDAEKAAALIDQAMGRAALKLGGFAQQADSAAAQIKNQWGVAGKSIEDTTRRIIQSLERTGQIDLGVEEANAATQAARQRLVVLQLQERAQLNVIGTEERASEVDKVFIARIREKIAAQQAEITELEQVAGGLERYQIEMRQSASGHTPLVNAQKAVTAQSGAARAGMQQLSFQLSDVATQFAAGTPPMIIFAQQSSQVVQAVSLMTQESKGLLGVLGNPWVQVFTAGLVVAAPFVAKMFESADATDKAAKKLQEDADQAEVDRRAHEAFTNTIAGQIEWQRKLNEELERQLKTQRQINQENLRGSQTNVTNRTTDVSAAERALAKATTAYREARAALEKGPSGAGGADEAQAQLFAAADAERRLREAQKNLQDARDALKQAQIGVRDNGILIAQQQAAAMADPLTAISQKYEDMAQAATAAASTQDVLSGALARSLAQIEKQKNAALEAARATKKALGGDSASADNSLGNMIALIRTLFPGARITSTNSGKHKAGSDHYQDRAIDFVPAGGMASISKADVERILRDAGVNIRRNAAGVEQLFGPGDKGHNDHFHVAWQGAGPDVDQVALKKQTEELLARFRDPIRSVSKEFADAQGKAIEQATKKEYDDMIALNAQRGIEEFRVRQEAIEKAARLEAQKIDTLAGLFEDGFRGGTAAIWDDFQRIGLRVITLVMAKFAVAQLSGKGGGFSVGDAFGSALSSVLGFKLFSRGGEVQRRAGGGYISGPGTATSDDIPAWLSDGEYVLRAQAVRRIGVPALDALNSGQTPRFASGGLVSPRLPVARMAAGAGGGDSAGGVTIQINAPGATAETVAMIRRELANAMPVIVQTATANTTRQLNRRSL